MRRVAWAFLIVAALSGCSGRTCASNSAGERARKAPGYVGLSEDAAISKAKAAGAPVRVMCRDGEVLGGTADLREDRVNLDVDDDRVKVAYLG
jgi:hypothetical protein